MDEYNKQPGQTSYGEGAGSGGTGTAARMKEQISDTAADVKDKVTEFGRKTADKIDDSRESAASDTQEFFKTQGGKNSGRSDPPNPGQ